MKIRSKYLTLIILVCVVALYNFVLFISTMNVVKSPTFWISYAFIMFSMAIGVLTAIVKNPFTSGTKLALMVTLIRVIRSYFVFEFIVGTLFMFLQYVVSIKLALLIQIPLLVIFVIIGLVVLLGANHISQSYAKQKSDVLSLNMLYVQVSSLASSVKNADIAQKLSIIADKIKFSDFNSYPELAGEDSLIRSTITEMKITEDEATLSNLVVRLDRLVDERNEMCKYIKKSRG